MVSLTVNLIVVPEVACCEPKTIKLKIYFDYIKSKRINENKTASLTTWSKMKKVTPKLGVRK